MSSTRESEHVLAEIMERDPRFQPAAYEFVFEALSYTQAKLDRHRPELTMEERHISGQELVDGIRELALERFGMLANVVFEQWGLRRTVDFGDIVFNLIESQLMHKTDMDEIADFENRYDFRDAFVNRYHIPCDQIDW